ncbi:unnamed protein product, partial [Lymnaea stagnalis]
RKQQVVVGRQQQVVVGTQIQGSGEETAGSIGETVTCWAHSYLSPVSPVSASTRAQPTVSSSSARNVSSTTTSPGIAAPHVSPRHHQRKHPRGKMHTETRTQERYTKHKRMSD